jgi:hypothetical protein
MDELLTEIGTMELRGCEFLVEKELFEEENDATTGDLHLLFDPLGHDQETVELCDEFLEEVQTWVRQQLTSPDLKLDWRESGAQAPGFLTFSFTGAQIAA